MYIRINIQGKHYEHKILFILLDLIGFLEFQTRVAASENWRNDETTEYNHSLVNYKNSG